MNENKILVTGGAGFIGTNLCRRLLEQGNKVYCLDNLSTGRLENLEILKNYSNFTFIKHDIINPICNSINIDQIYNLACPASPPRYQQDPIKTIKINTLGLFNILNFARNCNAKILHASTSEIYGDPEIHPQNENYRGNVNTIGPRSCYDEGKRISETICYEYFKNYNLDIKMIRIFNTYGPFMDSKDGRVVSNFINQALKGDDITIFGDGNQTRSFQYIDDLVDAILKIMDLKKEFLPFNIGNPDEFTMIELANLIIELTQSKSTITYKELPIDDPKKRKPDITLANRTIEWYPGIDLRTGLLKTIKYFESIL